MAALGAWRGLVGTRPAQDPELPPAMAEGLRLARREIPDLAPVDVYGPISKLTSPNAQAYTSVGRNIYLNPAEMANLTPQQVADTITHEQQHVQQMRARGQGRIGEFFHTLSESAPYGQRPDEIEAFQAEVARRQRLGRPQEAIPTFAGGYRTPREIEQRPNDTVAPYEFDRRATRPR
jgi:hypothetical protein